MEKDYESMGMARLESHDRRKNIDGIESLQHLGSSMTARWVFGFVWGSMALFLVATFTFLFMMDSHARADTGARLSDLLELVSPALAAAASSSSRGSSYGAALKTGAVWTMVRSGYDPLPYFTSGYQASDKRKYAFLSGYVGIIEPYAENDLYLEGYNDDGDEDYYYTYKVCTLGEGKKTACESGKLYSYGEKTKHTSVVKECTPFETLTVTIYKLSKTGNKKKGKTTGSLLCMYVRREMRSLSSTDLSAAMDAIYNLYSTSEEDGQAEYGMKWHNSTYFTKAHHFNAAWVDGDHIHEGLGFLPQHIKVTH